MVNVCQKDNRRWRIMKTIKYCLQSTMSEINLRVVKCESGSAEGIFKRKNIILHDFASWSSITMMNSCKRGCSWDTAENVTHRSECIFVIGCQNHIFFDRLLTMFFLYLNMNTTSPSLNYKFIDIRTERYEVFKESYSPKVKRDACSGQSRLKSWFHVPLYFMMCNSKI